MTKKKHPSDHPDPEFGEMKFNIIEPMFIFSEAVEITGVPAKSLNNWTQRGVIDIGVMHRTGRRMYSVADLVELAIVAELAEFVDMKPGLAVGIAKYVKPRMFEMNERDEDGEIIYRGPKNDPERRFIRVWFADGAHKIKVEKGTDWLNQFAHLHPFIIVPLDHIILKIENKSIDILEREWKRKKEEGGAE